MSHCEQLTVHDIFFNGKYAESFFLNIYYIFLNYFVSRLRNHYQICEFGFNLRMNGAKILSKFRKVIKCSKESF